MNIEVRQPQRDAKARLCHLFCELALRQHEDGVPASVFIPLTQEQLASVIGITAIHVNRVLRRIRAEKRGSTRTMCWTFWLRI